MIHESKINDAQAQIIGGDVVEVVNDLWRTKEARDINPTLFTREHLYKTYVNECSLGGDDYVVEARVLIRPITHGEVMERSKSKDHLDRRVRPLYE